MWIDSYHGAKVRISDQIARDNIAAKANQLLEAHEKTLLAVYGNGPEAYWWQAWITKNMPELTHSALLYDVEEIEKEMSWPWKRKGLSYFCHVEVLGGYRERRLNFISYWLIKWVHGEIKLIQMGIGK